jgi:uncharacterized membrane protein YhaH (DUF805 family)
VSKLLTLIDYSYRKRSKRLRPPHYNIKASNILFIKISKEDLIIFKIIILLSLRVKRHKDIKIPNIITISNITLFLKKLAYKTILPYLILRVFIILSFL